MHMQQYVEPIYIVYRETLVQWFLRWVNGSGFRDWRVSKKMIAPWTSTKIKKNIKIGRGIKMELFTKDEPKKEVIKASSPIIVDVSLKLTTKDYTNKKIDTEIKQLERKKSNGKVN